MHTRLSQGLLCASAVVLVAAPALAAEPLAITTRMLVDQRVAAADGTTRTQRVAPTRIVPGERVAIVITYRNTGTAPIANLVLANPVPASMAYRGPADGSPAPDVSVGGSSFGSLGTLRIPAIGGGTRVAGPNDVTHVRWRLASPLAAGSRGELAFQAVLK